MKKHLLLLFILLITSHPQVKSYTGEEIYNPYGNSNCIIQDKIGYIWCGTNEGFSRYDGFNFTPVYTGDPVKTLAEDSEGNIFGGTINGEIIKYSRASGRVRKFQIKPDPLFYYQSKDFTKLPLNYVYNKNTTLTTILIKKDFLYAGTWGSGMFVFNLVMDKQIEHLYHLKDENSLPGNYISSIIEADEDSSILCGSFDAGLIKINLINKDYSVQLNDHQVTSLCKEENNLWAGTLQGLLKSDSLYNKYDKAINTSVTHLYSNGNIIAAANSDGINIIDSKSRSVINSVPYNGNNNSLLSLMIDKTGNIWGSISDGLGLIKWKKTNNLFSHYPLTGVSAFAATNKGDILIGTSKDGLYKFSLRNNSFTQIKKELSAISDLIYSTDGNLYIVSSGNLLSYDDKKNYYHNILSNKNISCLAQTPDGTIWAGTSGDGIIKIVQDRSVWKNSYYKKSNIYPGSIPDNYIKKLFVSKDELWGYTREGMLFRYLKEKDEFVNWKIKETQTSILTVFAKGEHIYIGTYGEGIYKFNKKDAAFAPVNYTGSSAFRNIFGILVDQFNNLWFSTESGILQFNNSQHQLFYYSLKDGIEEKQFTSSVQHITTNGSLLFGGVNGFVMFEPGKNLYKKESTDISITSFKVLNEERVLTSLPIELRSNENSLSFRFACLNYDDPQNNQYRWLLEGFEKKTHYSSGKMNYAEYNQLSPGKYLFRLQGANASGVWSKETVIPVIIALPFYMNWWFILLAVLIALSIPGYFLYIRLQNHMAIKEIKARLSADLHDEIGSGLTEISLIAEILKNNQHDNETGKDQLQFISQRARELVNNMSDIVWLVNPNESMLNELIIRLKNKCLPVTESLGINLMTNVNEDSEDCKLTMERKQNIYLILKEAVNNSIKYSHGKNIHILVNIEEKRFMIRINDDGTGFNPSDAQMGNGIRNMRKRAADIKAELEIRSLNTPDRLCGTSIILTGNL